MTHQGTHRNALWSLDKPSNVFHQPDNRDALTFFSGKMKREMKPTCRRGNL